jgi:hypothetical protein
MAETEALPADMAAVAEAERIRQLKYAYFRLLDTKRFEELGALLTDDCTSAYQSGELSHRGRQAIVEFLSSALADPGVVTFHSGHHPEIAVGPDGTATGTWYLEDRVIVAAADFELHGTALYRDEYRKVDGQWRISHTGYDRVFEERIRRSDGAVLSFSSMFERGTAAG